MSKRTNPPFRADHVGSLLRPIELSKARMQWKAGKISSTDLKELEDICILKTIKLQEDAGLQAITDGEFRRDYWHLDFIAAFQGIELNDETYGHTFSGGGTVNTFKVTERFGENSGYMRDHYNFVQSNTRETAKICIPAPGMTYLRSGRAGISEKVYPDLEEFWSDVVKAYTTEVMHLYQIGCRYIQFDDVSFAYLCDERFRQDMINRGDDPDKMVEIFANAITRTVENCPKDMTITTHMCRGNFQSTWMTTGGYEPVAEIMFNNLDVNGYFMEYDSERAGGFEPLRYRRNNQIVILGLISSKLPELEKADQIIKRIDEATKYVPLDDLCLSPQCGFSSTHHGNKLSEDDQKRKLELVTEVAEKVWGSL